MKQGNFTLFTIENILYGDFSGSDRRPAPHQNTDIEISKNHDVTKVSSTDIRKRKRLCCYDYDDSCQSLAYSCQSLVDSCPSPCSSISSSDISASDDADLKAPRKKKARTSFAEPQIDQMERIYHAQRYLAASERKRLARSLCLTDRQVKTWFQNRRMKEKRHVHPGHHCESPASHVTSGMSPSNGRWMSPTTGLVYNTLMMTSYGGLSQRPVSLSAAHPAIMKSYGGPSQQPGSFSASR